MTGSRMKIWKQDPWVPHLGVRLTYVHTPVRRGPSDPLLRVCMRGVERAFPDEPSEPPEPDEKGDFLHYCQRRHPAQFRAVHTFAVARQVLTMFLRAIGRRGGDRNFRWRWGRQPLALRPFHPRFESGIGKPLYSPATRSIDFSFFDSEFVSPSDGCEVERPRRGRVFICESFDLIAHEMGHAILDGLRERKSAEIDGDDTNVLKEAFADLAAVFTTLAQMDQVEAIIAHSKADLFQSTFVSAIAERYGELRRQAELQDSDGIAREPPLILTGLRNAYNRVRVGDPGTIHEQSQVLTGAVYDILLARYAMELELYRYDPAETLFRAGRYLMPLVVQAFIEGFRPGATLADIACQILALEEDEAFRRTMEWIFEARLIL